MVKIIFINKKLHFLFICAVIVQLGCFLFDDRKDPNFSLKQKYYLGTSSPSKFQMTVENILLYHNYSIESYDNNQTASIISTIWKVTEPDHQNIDTLTLEIKTKLLVEGKIISNSFSKENGFDYECYLYVKNLSFMCNQYIELYDDPLLSKNIHQIVEEFRINFNYHN